MLGSLFAIQDLHPLIGSIDLHDINVANLSLHLSQLCPGVIDAVPHSGNLDSLIFRVGLQAVLRVLLFCHLKDGFRNGLLPQVKCRRYFAWFTATQTCEKPVETLDNQ